MSQPLYFLSGIERSEIEGKSGLDRQIINEFGISHIFDGIPLDKTFRSNANHGPGGKSGGIIGYQTPTGDVPRLNCFDAKLQDWTEVDDGLWIGIDRDNPPTASDLARPEMHTGYMATLNGDTYTIPIVRRPDGSTELPRDFKVKPWREVIKARYREQWDQAGRVLEWIAKGGVEDELPEAIRIAINVLGINYRYGEPEHNVFGIIDSTNWFTVLHMACDPIKTQELLASRGEEKAPAPVADTSNEVAQVDAT